MLIRFLGAVRTTTGSMHMLSAKGRYLLLDCGLYQGKRKEAFERNRHLPFDPPTLDACILSHAHIDHSGNLPTLVRRGYRGPVYATPATIDLCDLLLRDSAHLQMMDIEYVNKKRVRDGKTPFEPLYLPEDVDALMKQFVPVNYETPTPAGDGFTITFRDAGHILGAATTEIRVDENGSPRQVFFTGDLGRNELPILRDPVVVHDAEILITESTYGNRLHPPKEEVGAKLSRLVNEICERGSKLIVPSFSVGRTQQILYVLEDLRRKQQIRTLPVYVDSPLSTHATEVYERHTECFDGEMLQRIRAGDSPFHFPGLTFITEVEDSKALNRKPGPMIIISASGMCEGGRILHHLKNNIGDSKNVILFVGFQAENTLGRRIIEGEQPVRIFGEDYRVAARVEKINALSGHPDRNELLAYYRAMAAPIQRAFVVHGEADQSEALAAAMRDMGIQGVEVPHVGEEVRL
jgi:metallo-beta-lactamase family protein